jgi:hypothetical protein
MSHSLSDGFFMPLKQDNFEIDNFGLKNAAPNAILTFNCVTVNSVTAIDMTLLKTNLTAHRSLCNEPLKWTYKKRNCNVLYMSISHTDLRKSVILEAGRHESSHWSLQQTCINKNRYL